MLTLLTDFRAQPLRSAITGLAMLIGVLTLSAVAVISTLAQSAVVAAQEQLHGREATYSVAVGQVTADSLSALTSGLSASLEPQGFHAVATVSDSLSVGPPSSTSATSSLENLLASAAPDAIYRWPVIAGQWTTASYLDTIALNVRAAETLSVTDVPSTIRVYGEPHGTRTVRVTAIYDDARSEPTSVQVVTDAGAVLTAASDATVPLLVLRAPVDSETALSDLVRRTAATSGITTDVEVSRQDTVGSVRESVSVVARSFLIAGLGILVVAGLGVVNIGLASVQQRSRELVIRRALGATRLDIVVLVLGNALVLSLLVALASFALVSVAVTAVYPTLVPATSITDSPSIPWSAAGIGLLAAVATGLLGSAAPAWKATRLPIADALRS